MLIFIQCASCKCEAPATVNEGRPDIPAHWVALCAELEPDYELYACSEHCGKRTGYSLSEAFPGSHILERRVELEQPSP